MTPTAEQREMAAAVADFLDATASPTAIRATFETGRHAPDLWRRGADELGLAAMVVPERCGGLGLGFGDAAVVQAEFGRRLVPSPLAATVIAATVLGCCGSADADDALRALAATGSPIGIAHIENDTDWRISTTTARPDRPAQPGGDAAAWRLSGAKRSVAHGAAVPALLVTANTDDGPAVFLVDSADPGVTVTPLVALDHTEALADIDFTDATARRVSRPGAGRTDVDRLIRLTWTMLAVQAVAGARACLTMTVDYLRVRHQFGRPIGSFQALKHRCADLAAAIQGASDTVDAAVDAVDAGGDPAGELAATVKLVAADTFMRAAAETIQMHGGIGFTFDHPAHLYFKRAKAIQLSYGTPWALRAHLAELIGL